MEFFRLYDKLYDGWTENKNAIDYNAFRKLFEIGVQGGKAEKKKGEAVKKTGGKKEGTKGPTVNNERVQEESKNEGNKEKPKNWIREVLTQVKKAKQR